MARRRPRQAETTLQRPGTTEEQELLARRLRKLVLRFGCSTDRIAFRASALEDFTHTVSHDLRSPVTSILLGVDRIEAGMPAVSQQDEDAVKEIVDLNLGPEIFAFCRCMASDIEIGGLVGVEALACGCRVVATKVGDHSPVVGVGDGVRAAAAGIGEQARHVELVRQAGVVRVSAHATTTSGVQA